MTDPTADDSPPPCDHSRIAVDWGCPEVVAGVFYLDAVCLQLCGTQLEATTAEPADGRPWLPTEPGLRPSTFAKPGK